MTILLPPGARWTPPLLYHYLGLLSHRELSLLDSISPPTGTSIDEGILLASTLSLAHSLARLRYLEVPLDNLTNYAALLVLLPAAVGVVFGARTLYGGPGESGEGKKWGARGLTFGHTAVLGTGGWMMRESPVLVLVPFSFLLAFYQYKTLQSGSIRLKLT